MQQLTILFAFNIKKTLSLNDIVNYCNRFKESDNIIIIKKNIQELIKYKYINNNNNNNNYTLTEKGINALNGYNNEYIYIIVCFYKKYKKINSKIFTIKETRPEQQSLRKQLLLNNPHCCFLCLNRFPECCLEAAHIKPRNRIEDSDKNNINNVILLCRICHILFDKGYLTIYNDKVLVSDKLNITNYNLPNYDKKITVTKEKEQFFYFHHNYIYNGDSDYDTRTD